MLRVFHFAVHREYVESKSIPRGSVQFAIRRGNDVFTLSHATASQTSKKAVFQQVSVCLMANSRGKLTNKRKMDVSVGRGTLFVERLRRNPITQSSLG